MNADPTPPAAPRPCECGCAERSNDARLGVVCFDCGRPVSPEAARCPALWYSCQCSLPDYHDGRHQFKCPPAEAAPPRATTPPQCPHGYEWVRACGICYDVYTDTLRAPLAAHPATTPEPMTEERLEKIRAMTPTMLFRSQLHAQAVADLLAEVDRLRSASPSRESGALLDAAQQEIARFWEIIDRIAEIIGAEESDLDIETAVQMYVDWATGNLAASDAHLSTLERDAARMREDSARLDFLESARCELGHGKYQRHVYPAMPDRTRPDCIGVTLREAIDEARALTPSGEATTTPETSDG